MVTTKQGAISCVWICVYGVHELGWISCVWEGEGEG